MGLRRGFKTEAAKLARDVRVELNLGPKMRFTPHVLAEHLAIPLLPLSELANEVPQAVKYFRSRGTGEFSAATIFSGIQRLIVYNDAHAPGRQANDLSHELSHALLFHEPKPALNALGCRDWDPEAEGEADCLAGVLLVPEEAAIEVVRRGLSVDAAADLYGVSVPLMRWRINMTGAHARVSRTRKLRTRRSN
jgi:Zn-dependent peptidase ImmA (M78 family)